MRKLTAIASLAVLLGATPVTAQEAEKPEMLSPGQIVDAAAPEEWQAIAASDLLVMNLTPDAAGKDRTIIIQLMPAPFSQGWVRNIRKLAKANWWDGTSINRVQDNYVVQWGDPNGGEEGAKPLPDGLEVMTESDYLASVKDGPIAVPAQTFSHHGPGPMTKHINQRGKDAYASFTDFHTGWPISIGDGGNWPIHCYGALGVGRGLTPDTGSGAELYTVIGHAPRHLDRNIAVVGRIVEGMHHLSGLPRGFGPLGFYETPEQRVAIQSIRLASELPAAEQPRFEYLSTEGKSFAQYANRRANREPPFFIKPAGGADICNIPVPVRRVKGE